MSDHTPPPWSFEVEEYQANVVRASDGSLLATIVGDSAEAEANAEIVVRAVNSHEALVDALKDALSALTYIRTHYAELYGVGFDRVNDKGMSALKLSAAPKLHPYTP